MVLYVKLNSFYHGKFTQFELDEAGERLKSPVGGYDLDKVTIN